MNSQTKLFARYITQLPPGELTWIGVRPARREPMLSLAQTKAVEELGLEGDHRMAKTPGSGRQVTLISEEFIGQISHFLGGKPVPPERLRRNLVVKNINLNALRYQNFQIGDAIFQAGALCHPCTRMEQALGKGAIAAMMGYGGLCCKIIRSGEIKVGDSVELITPQQALF
ncbi:MOSC domain-containing protein [Bermanella sp. WJH001]|uniref:MOSC domain-containing protein n=1 Tax=Bermanella sp. WJH001 TaxID=3048005 RepID=UPI0024BE12CF|nr:MOSC domain-containing protein [Bermanella sp. WJH001]MDJ1537809.1 MOSC domain-containing protein [Bermanella sp. WJH001]